MKTFKRILAIFAALHWLAVIHSAAMAGIGVHFYSSMSESQRMLYNRFDSGPEEFLFTVIAAIVGLIAASVITAIGLRNHEYHLKAECRLLLAFALSTLPISYSIIAMAMSV